jgi:3',5'-cyclic AMP phosphodiesterase CpdA
MPNGVAVRLAHLSDIHVTAPEYIWRREDWLNKRLAAWFNLRVLGRGFRFRRAERVLDGLRADLDARGPDRTIFSGDATAMGFEEEVARAAALLQVDDRPGLAVPGNHDYCTRSAMLSGAFERYFSPWQAGERTGPEIYPFAQRTGNVWLVAVNSATANRWAWDARGAVGRSQLERLQRLLDRLEGGLRILVTHYPVALASGQPERRVRLLRDLDDLVAVAARGGISLWLHGHRHDPYYHARADLAPFPVICAGSATQTGLWSYGEYTIRGNHLVASQRIFEPEQGSFREGPSFELDLSCPQTLLRSQ